jgi:hypothetical protein
MRRLSVVAVTVLLCYSGCAFAESSVAKVPAGTKSTQKIKPNLSNDECTQLGGTVFQISVDLCGSAYSCQITDKTGKYRTVCISKAK